MHRPYNPNHGRLTYLPAISLGFRTGKRRHQKEEGAFRQRGSSGLKQRHSEFKRVILVEKASNTGIK